MYIVYKSKD